VEAHPTGDVALGGDVIALRDVADVLAGGHDGAGKLVAPGERRKDALLGPLVPMMDVQVGPADAGGFHLHEHLVLARLRDRHFLDSQPWLGFHLPNRSHRSRHVSPSTPCKICSANRITHHIARVKHHVLNLPAVTFVE